MVQNCFEVDCPWHKEIFSRKYKAKNRGKDKICSRAMTGESLAMMSLTRPHFKKIQMGRNLACVFCSGKQYLDNVLRSECQVYEFKQKVHTFENLAAGRTTWEQVILVARSWMRVLLRTEPSQVSAAPHKTAFCGSPAWARAQPKEEARKELVKRKRWGPRRGCFAGLWVPVLQLPGGCKAGCCSTGSQPGSALPWPNAVSGISLIYLKPRASCKLPSELLAVILNELLRASLAQILASNVWSVPLNYF